MGVFDIMGPIMIGPSSSHTAGAARLGRLARLVFKKKIVKADIYLHGSFAETYRGHGTDRALVGGILGFKPDDNRIKDSLKIANSEGIGISFNKIKLRDVHPNTVKIKLSGEEEELTLIGSSTGGGEITVSQIDDYEVDIDGKLPTLWVLHLDRPGEVGVITSILGRYSLNIAFMKVFRRKRGKVGSSIIELDQSVDAEIIQQLVNLPDVILVRYIPPL